MLLDGLDEVNPEGERRARIIAMLNDFIYEYESSPMLLTCREAASDYSFTQFAYAEMADELGGSLATVPKGWRIQRTTPVTVPPHA